MKKVIFSALFVLCITATGAWAQKGNAEQPTETGSTSTSTAREGRNVGKGSPLLQRNAGPSGGATAPSAPAATEQSKAAPAPAPAPAPAATPAKTPAATPAKAPAAAPAETESHPETEHKSNKLLPVLVAPPPSNDGQK